MDTRRLVDNVFQQDHGNVKLEERIKDDALQAFALADAIHELSFEDDIENRGVDIDDVDMDETVVEMDVDRNNIGDASCQPWLLKEAINLLYRSACCIELVASILLVNLCKVHGVSNNFAKELFNLLHNHLLSEENTQPKNHYIVKSVKHQFR